MTIKHTHAYLQFAREFDDQRSNDFQSWVANLLEMIHGAGDFNKVRVSRGDKGIDGHVISRRRIYQCYAARNSTDREMAEKIKGDFQEAYDFLKNQGGMAEWIFIYGDMDGALGSKSVAAVNELIGQHPGMLIETWNRDRLWSEVHQQMPLAGLQERFGLDVTRDDVLRLQVPEILNVLDHLEEKIQMHPPNPSETPSEKKLDYNEFSPAYREFLANARLKVRLVEQIFDHSQDVSKGEKIAKCLNAKYQELRLGLLSNDRILDGLKKYCSYFEKEEISHQAAVSVVLAYFFDKCDIFENAPHGYDS